MPYISANRSIIKGFFPDIKRKYPEATVFYAGQIEYTCLTDEARQMLVLSLSKRVEDMQRDIKAYKKILNEAQ